MMPAVIIQESVCESQMDVCSEMARLNPGQYIFLGLLDYSQSNLSQWAWSLMNHGMEGVAISCKDLGDRGISLTSQKMMQLFRIMEDRDAYLLISLGEEEKYKKELHDVVSECTRLKVIIDPQIKDGTNFGLM